LSFDFNIFLFKLAFQINALVDFFESKSNAVDILPSPIVIPVLTCMRLAFKIFFF